MARIAEQEMTTIGDDAAAAPAVERAYLWSGEFADREIERGFRDESWNETIERTRGIQLIILVFAGWSFVDYLIFGPTLLFVMLCAGRMLSIPLSYVPTHFFGKARQHTSFYASLTAFQAYVFGVFLLVVNAGGMAPSEHALSALIIIFAFYFGIPNRLKLNVFVSVVATVAFIAVLSRYDGLSLRSIALVALLLLVGNFCGAQAVRVTNRLRRNEFLTLMHHKELNDQLSAEIAVRKEAQRAVQVTEENFQSIFVAAPLPLALIDPTTHRVVQANKAALELFGLPDDEMESFDARRVFADEDMRLRFGAETMGGPRLRSFEARLVRKGGEIIWASISTALVRFHGVPSFLVALQDVTARRREAEALRQARDQATDASRSKSEFLANMSHELRTPLNAIIGFSEALERELFGPVGNPRYREYAEDIHDSGVHLLNLINDILDLSKIEAGHFKLHEDTADLDAITASACRIVRHRAQQAAITIETALPRPPLSLIADERALKQVLINLISNAVKFSNDRGTVRIEATVRAEGLRIAVIDHGIGIAEEDIPKALAPFTQVDGTLSRTHEGTGLGLPLAKHLTELHDGELTIVSVPGEGTTVYVDLPASRLVSGQHHIDDVLEA
ncbi:MAG: PAS domain S-box protein [Parvibaculum sp.]|uniref:PAS domain-containing sensor histidine kinase n=1 Tax=Parvibaculum sp. TaxID=2024848 RepID=UPI0025D17BE0|nr:ATP-binding protein [Parvibaculum sp.]MCE9650550.1 PAS domain S-box protein [Parvibaculum sp.]